jgi:hypothetical protein
MEQWFVILWTDNAGVARHRLIAGTEAEANEARRLLAAKYADGEGFLNARIYVTPGPVGLVDILNETEAQ